MTTNRKAVKNLVNKGINAFEENQTVYVEINDVQLELSQFEIDFQAQEYTDWNNGGAE